MAVTVGVGVVPIKPDFGNFHRDIDREGSRAASGLTSHFTGAFKKIAALSGGLLIGSQLISGFKAAFNEAAEAQKIGKLTEQVIKSTGGAAKVTVKEIENLSAAISRKTAVDDETIQSGANLIATFTRVRNEAGKGNDIFSQTVAVANDMSVALGQDMKSSSLQLGKALNDPIKGVTALTRAGVSFTQQQKDQIKSLQESGDLLGAQKLILAEVAVQFGGAAEAAATPVGKLRVIWGNLLEDVGTRAMPVISKMAEWFSRVLPAALDASGKAFGWLGDRLAPVVGWFRNAVDMGGALFAMFRSGDADAQGFAEILDNVFGNTGNLIGPLISIYGAVQDLISGLGRLRTIAAPALRWAVDFVAANPAPSFAALATVIGVALVPATVAWAASLASAAAGMVVVGAPIIAVGVAAGALAGAVMYLWQNFERLRPVITLIGARLTGMIGVWIWAYKNIEILRVAVDAVADVFQTVLGAAVRGVIELWQRALLPAIQTVARFFMEVLWPAVQSSFQQISMVATWAWTSVLQPIFGFLDATLRNVVIPAFNFLKAVVVDFVFPLVMAIIKDAWGVIQPVFAVISWTIANTVVPAFHMISHAVSTVWGFVRPIFQEIMSFITDKFSPVWQGIAFTVGAAFGAIPGLIRGAMRLVGGIVSGFLDGVGNIAQAIGLNDIAKVLRNGAGTARTWGSEPVPTSDTRSGGQYRGFARGGQIPGNHDRDDVPIYATPGEWVITKPAVEQYERKYGKGFMEAFNAGHFAAGGLIPGLPDIDLPGLADGVVDKVRSLGSRALETVWPKLATGDAMTGLPAGGANYLRDAVIQLIRGKEQEMGSMSGGGFTRAGGGGPAGQYTAGMQRARADILNLFGPMSVGGYANRNIAGTNQRSAHGMWRAWDFMVGMNNVSKGNAISRHLIANASQYGLKGLIWNAQKNFGSGWQPYGHPGGGRSATLQHLDHVHAEFFRQGGLVHPRSFDTGGVLAPGWNAVRNDTGSDEHLIPRSSAPLVGEVHINSPEDVDEFWRRAEFSVMAGRL